MKRFAFPFLLILLAAFPAFTQEDAAQALKKAKRSLGAYNLDPGANAPKLQEAWEGIGIALSDVSIQSDPEAWITKGQICIEAANKDMAALMINPAAKPAYPAAAIQGLEAFKEGLRLSVKKYNRKDALTGIRDLITPLNNYAISSYQANQLDAAHQGFTGVLESHEILVREGEKSPLDDKAYNDAMFSAAATCDMKKDGARCAGYLEKLREASYPNVYIYDLLYTAYVETDKVKAVRYLEEGRSKFPDEVSLLFTEINHYLREGRMDELVGKLKAAIGQEPDNKSLYLTLGNVYDNLFQKASEAKDAAKSEEYFQSALEYYGKALEKDPEYMDATYSIGALYYNRAATYTQEMNKLADDYSKPGIAKYNAMKEQVEKEFDKALPYFQKAERMDPNDLNTLIALKEIYARKNELNVSNEFKTRLEKVQSGQKIESSYFSK